MRADVNLFTLAAALVCAASAGPARADVVISSQATQNMSCSGGKCSPTATNAVLNVGDLETMLASGNVEVTTTSSGVQAQNIRLDAALAWSATSTLTLDARKSISVDEAVTIASLGGLTVNAGSSRSKDTFSFGPSGSITFENLASSLRINGKTFTLEDSLPALATAANGNPNGRYALASNYDASKDGTYSVSPIALLNGAIEGLGNSISNLSIDVTDDNADEGLVTQVGQHGSIENLRLVDIDYQADSSGYNGAGGLVAVNGGYLFGDEVSGAIVSTGSSQSAGGIAGYSGYDYKGYYSGTIDHCSANVTITGNGGSFGGLVGWNDGTIELSSTSGAVTGFLAGGIVGQNEGPVSQSFATGAISGGSAGGGVVGSNTSNGEDTGTVRNSYATGNVGGGAGGFVGNQVGGEISASYSTGAVQDEGGFGCTGAGIQVSDDYWDMTTSGTSYGWCGLNINGTIGLTTRQLRKKLPHGFDKKIWAEDPKINNGFPYLIANPPAKK